MIQLRRGSIGAFAAIILAALLLRLTSFSLVYSQGGFVFLDPDSYYHMRRIALAAMDFPSVISFDTYIDYPYGFILGWPPLYDGLIAGSAYVLGFGNPSVFLIEMLAAASPVVIGLLTLIPVYYIGRELFRNEAAGICSAAILAILPAHVLVSVFGYVDHHVFESFLFACMLLCLLFGVRRPEESDRWAFALGIVCIAAIYSFPGAPIYIGIIGFSLVGMFILRRMKNLPSGDLLRFAIISFGLAALVVGSINFFLLGAHSFIAQGALSLFQPACILIMLLGIICTGLLAYVLRQWHWTVFIGALGGGGAVCLAVCWFFLPPLFAAIQGGVGYISRQDPILLTIYEAQPLFFPDGTFSLIPILSLFAAPLFLAIGGLFVYLAARIRSRLFDDADLLILFSFLCTFALTVFQIRFLYVLALPVAIAAGYGMIRVLELPGSLEVFWRGGQSSSPSESSARIRVPALLLISLIVFVPTVYSASGIYTTIGGTPDDDLLDALRYLRLETPDPGGYADLSVIPDYGVMSFWDLGNQIIYLAERPVVSNNFQAGIYDSVRFFTTASEDEAIAILNCRGVAYVLTESIGLKKFSNFLIIDGVDPEQLSEEELLERMQSSVYYRLHYQSGHGLSHFKLLYASPSKEGRTGAVKIFEYV